MSYTTLYRKWRPAPLEDVKDQDPIMQILKNQITSERISHAYLFYGTRGTGKASIAKIFAKAVNCEHPVDNSPCNECSTCRSIQSGSSMNVMGIDAASNNGMESIRGIREQVQCPPTEGRYRVYIVDEVHMLSIGTLNTLLKTLEEPPFYVTFILTITEVHKVPITILSCCQRYDFKRISLETIADRLRKLTQAEQIQVEGKTLLYVTKAADGSLKGALSLLDQYAAFRYGRVLAYGSALEVLRAVDSSVFGQMSGAIVEGRTRNCICNLEETVIRGWELSRFIIDFVWYMRNLLLIRSADNAEGLVGMSEESLKQLRSDADEADGTTLMWYVRISSELSSRLRYANQEWVLVEAALIKLTRPSMEPNLDTILQRLGDLETQMEDLEAGRVTIPATATYRAADSPPARQVSQAGAGPGQDEGTTPQTAAPYAPGLQAEPGVVPEKVTLPRAQLEDLKLIRDEWAKIVRSMGGGARSYLRDTVMKPGERDCLTIVFMNPMDYDMRKRPTIMGGLECYVEASFSRFIYFRTRLAGRGERLNTIYITQGELEEKIHVDITCEDE